MWFEQATVEVGDGAEPHFLATAGRWLVQRTKKQRIKNRSVEVAAPRQGCVQAALEIVGTSIQPSLFLHKVEKEDTRESKEGHHPSVVCRPSVIDRCRHPLEVHLERGEELLSHLFAAQHIGNGERMCESVR